MNLVSPKIISLFKICKLSQDVKQSESHQKLMKAQQQETSSEEGDDGPIVKNGCPHAMLAAA